MITHRFEKGNKILDLIKHEFRALDDDGFPVIDEYWECLIYRNGDDPVNGNFETVNFDSELIARMFIKENNWVEQVL